MTGPEWNKVIRYLVSQAGGIHKLYSEKEGWIKLSYKTLRRTVTQLDSFDTAIRTIDLFINLK